MPGQPFQKDAIPTFVPHETECKATGCVNCMLRHFSCVQLFAALWTATCQAPPSMGFPRQAYGSGLPFPPPGDLPHPGTEHTSLMSPTLAGFLTTTATWETLKELSTETQRSKAD